MNSQRYPTRKLDSIAGKLVIVVKDTGAGISKENQKRLFTEIVQFNPEILQAGGGSGLGLWITKGIVDLHDGSIRVFSGGIISYHIISNHIPSYHIISHHMI